MKLVVVESPSKAKTIQKYLGKGFKVVSSKGHVVDLPKSQLGVNIENNFQPEYIVTKKATVNSLKKAFKGSDGLILAVDPDREGEAIGWHVARELGVLDKNSEKSLERIVFTEITKQAVQEAVKSPRQLNFDLINAQQARRVLDRLVGYKLSPLLWKKIRYGLSAGRVQSVALRLIVEREMEREAFKPEEFWSINAYLSLKEDSNKLESHIKLAKDEVKEKIESTKKGLVNFGLVKYKGKKVDLTKNQQVQKLLKELAMHKPWQITEVKKSETKRRPRPPFSTSSMQQAAANRLGFSASRTMKAAQKLYEAGHITYMRTDSITLAQSAITAARKYIQKELGKNYLPEKPVNYSTKSKVAQEAHEAIRPTQMQFTASKIMLTGDQAKLYDLIRNRAIASQVRPAIVENNKVIIEFDDYVFQANGQRILFDGYLHLYPEKFNENILPALNEGQDLHPKLLEAKQHFTQPPARYSEASLIKTLEKLGIGRPSTYAPIVQTIISRRYVEKDGKYFLPTDTGRVVDSLLKKHFPDIVDVKFTANMEQELDYIASGKRNWVEMMHDFYVPFKQHLNKKQEEIKKEDFTVLGQSDHKCPDCGSKMVIKLGKYGRFLSCSKFPDCKGMLGLDEEGNVEKKAEEKVLDPDFVDKYLPAPKTDDGRDYLLKKGRYGQFWAHPDYPKVKDAKPLQLRPEKVTELYGQPPTTKDGKDFVLCNGKFGPFWAHPDYPKEKKIISIKKAKEMI